MLKTYGGAFGRFITSSFAREPDDGLVKLFRVEYNREYRNAKHFGARVDEKFVKTFLKENSNYIRD